jgi:hypothetical protein
MICTFWEMFLGISCEGGVVEVLGGFASRFVVPSWCVACGCVCVRVCLWQVACFVKCHSHAGRKYHSSSFGTIPGEFA